MMWAEAAATWSGGTGVHRLREHRSVIGVVGLAWGVDGPDDTEPEGTVCQARKRYPFILRES